MRAKMRWRYYCDFCPKAGGSKAHMRTHEASCTRNPDRTCRMCGRVGDLAALQAAALVSLAALEAEAKGCPVCMLIGKRHVEQHVEGHLALVGDDHEMPATRAEVLAWDFRAAQAAWWAEVNREKAREYYGGGYGL